MSALRTAGTARRTVLPLLAGAAAVAIPAIIAREWSTLGMRDLPPLEFILELAVVAVFFALPVLLLAASGLWLTGAWRVGVACLIAAYGVSVANPVEQLLLETGDYLEQGRMPASRAGQVAEGSRMMRANPDPAAAARTALRWGDTRIYVVRGVAPSPVGIHWTRAAGLRYGSREMPGFGDSGPRAGMAYRRQAMCWAFRYNLEMANGLNDPRLAIESGEPYGCSPPGPLP